MPIENCKNYKKHYNIAQQIINSSDKLSQSCLHNKKHMILFVKKLKNKWTQIKKNLSGKTYN